MTLRRTREPTEGESVQVPSVTPNPYLPTYLTTGKGEHHFTGSAAEGQPAQNDADPRKEVKNEFYPIELVTIPRKCVETKTL